MFTLTIYFIALNVSVEFVLIYRPHPVYTVPRGPVSVPSSELRPPTTSPASECASPPEPKGEAHSSLTTPSYQLEAGQLLSGQPVRYGKGRRYDTSITYKITLAGSLTSSQPGGPSCWTSPL
jgi:hypothetical protein